MNRLFFALWPDDIARRRCAGIIHSLATAEAQPVSAANLHVTLVFLGNVPTNIIEPLVDRIGRVQVPALKIKFNRLSFWKKPGVLCLTASSTTPSLLQLVSGLSAVAAEFNIKIDNRPYKPHITLLRNARALTAFEFEPVIWRSTAFCLVSSYPGQYGVEYKIIKDWRADG